MKELQQQMLEDVKDKGQLDSEKMDWLMNEHRNNQTTLNGLYDDQIARQRLLLEEKLARRRALAERAVSGTHVGHKWDTCGTSEPGYLTVHDSLGTWGVRHSEVSWPL